MPRSRITNGLGKVVTLDELLPPAVPANLDELSKGELATLAASLGIDVKKSWSAERLQEEIEAATDPDEDEDEDED